MIKLLTFSPEIRPLWNSIASSGFPFSQFDWHEAWAATIADDWIPHPLSINGHLIAPLALRGDTITFSGGKEVCDYMDLIGPQHEKPNAWRAIINYCSQEGIRQMTLPNVPEGSSTLSYFQNEVKQLNTIHHLSVVREDTTPIIRLPPTWETYTVNLDRKDKHELERKLRKFEREHPDWVIHTSQSPSEGIAILLDQMKTDQAKNLFLTREMQQFFREIVMRFTASIELLILEEKGQPIASTLSFVTPSDVLLYNSGLDEVAYPGAGFFLKAHAIKRAIDQGKKTYNFLQGSERYKYELGGEDMLVYTITVSL